MQGQAGVLCDTIYVRHVFQRDGDAAGRVMAGLHADQTGRGNVTAGRPYRRSNIRRIHDPVSTADRARYGAGHCRHPPHLRVVNMRDLVDDDFFARLDVGKNGGQVRHRAAGRKERRLFSRQFGSDRFQLVHRGIVSARRVANLRHRDCAHHLLRRLGDGIAPEIEHRLTCLRKTPPLTWNNLISN